MLIQYLRPGGRIHPHERRALSFIEQSQDQTIFGIVLDVSRMWSVVPGPKRPPFAGRLALAAGQVYDHLVLCKCGRDVKHVDKQPLGIPIDGLGSCRTRARAMSWPRNLALGPAATRGR